MKSLFLPKLVGACVLLSITTASEASFLANREYTVIPPFECTTSMSRRTNRVNQGQHSVISSTTNFKYRGGASSSDTNKLSMVPVSAVFDNAPFLQSSQIILLSNLFGFVVSLTTGSHLHLDLIGTGAFSIAALPALLSSDVLRVKLSSGAVAVWGAKLAGFLFFRALKLSHDTRLDTVLSTAGGAAGFWFVSALWGIVCSLPHTLGTTSSVPGNPIVLSAGMALFSLGLITETVADLQKWSFKQGNPGKFCDVGLWGVTQHPNYFGNLILWSGILLMNAPSLIDIPSSSIEGGSILARIWDTRRAVVALLSPLFMWWFFSSQANGSMTNAVELASAKYGDDPNYKKYLESVPMLVPGLFKWLRQLLPGKA